MSIQYHWKIILALLPTDRQLRFLTLTSIYNARYNLATMNTKTTNKKDAFGVAKEAISTLGVVSKLLDPSELETLEILMDKELKKTLDQSLKDAKSGRVSSLDSIR